MRKLLIALSRFGLGLSIFPFQWVPFLRWQRYADRWGAMIIITIGPIDLTISYDHGPLGPARGGPR